MLTYVVADIHGRADLLLKLLERLRDHAPGERRRAVFLGDYVDRGPDSALVVRTLRTLQESFPQAVTCLAGNHEDMLLRAREGGARDVRQWMRNGGDAVLASYGVARVDDLPRQDVAWLAGLPTLHEDAQRYYVHAGLRPGLPPLAATREDRLWIRDAFLDGDHDFGKHVVHGHTPREGGPEVLAHRTNLDTGAVFTGRLVAGVFTEAQAPAVAFLEAREAGTS